MENRCLYLRKLSSMTSLPYMKFIFSFLIRFSIYSIESEEAAVAESMLTLTRYNTDDSNNVIITDWKRCVFLGAFFPLYFNSTIFSVEVR